MAKASLFESGKGLVVRHERHLSSGAFLAGFLIDTLTLTRIDFWVNHVVIFSYISIATIGIFSVQLMESKRLVVPFFLRVSALLPLVIQFAFGALFSALLVYYARSASFSTSLVFVFFLIAMMVGNEFLRVRYARLEFQLSVLYVIIFAFLIFYVPITVNQLGMGTFLLSGVLSLLLFVLIVFALSLIAPVAVRQSFRVLFASVGGIFALINVLYFTNVIPPIPLSLKEGEVYHFVVKADEDYVGFGEARYWRLPFLSPRRVFHRTEGEEVYYYSAVFAPTEIITPIYHEWQFYDESSRSWETKSRISFPVVGGRDSGYRGYSVKSALAEGHWRVLVKTSRGQVVGRTSFFVVEVDTPVPLISETLR